MAYYDGNNKTGAPGFTNESSPVPVNRPELLGMMIEEKSAILKRDGWRVLAAKVITGV
jgi:hypothetical protein